MIQTKYILNLGTWYFMLAILLFLVYAVVETNLTKKLTASQMFKVRPALKKVLVVGLLCLTILYIAVHLTLINLSIKDFTS